MDIEYKKMINKFLKQKMEYYITISNNIWYCECDHFYHINYIEFVFSKKSCDTLCGVFKYFNNSFNIFFIISLIIIKKDFY